MESVPMNKASTQHVTYRDMAARHGQTKAIDLLLTIERLAKIEAEISSMDVDARFDKAFKALCEIDFSAQD